MSNSDTVYICYSNERNKLFRPGAQKLSAFTVVDSGVPVDEVRDGSDLHTLMVAADYLKQREAKIGNSNFVLSTGDMLGMPIGSALTYGVFMDARNDCNYGAYYHDTPYMDRGYVSVMDVGKLQGFQHPKLTNVEVWIEKNE